MSGTQHPSAVARQNSEHTVAITSAELTGRNDSRAAFDSCAGNLRQRLRVLFDSG